MARCLVTGGAGLIGSHIVDLLVEKGHDVDVIDNLERALGSIQQDHDADHIKKGIEMILRQSHDVLKKEEVFPIESVGEIFDPHLHETIARVKCDSESGIIVEELQRGYRFKSKVIRACMVKVAE